jgi:transcriptional regulator with XRE-family HTH domain
MRRGRPIKTHLEDEGGARGGRVNTKSAEGLVIPFDPPAPGLGKRRISPPVNTTGAMPLRRRSTARRTALQVRADTRAQQLASDLGRALREARRRSGLSQARVAELAAIGQTTVSELERGLGADVSLLVWTRAAHAAATDLRAYLERVAAADVPRDAVHLRHQELLISMAAPGGWKAMPEAAIDTDRQRSRAADVVLQRGKEYILSEIWDRFDDVGASLRAWDRRMARLEALAIARLPVGVDTPPTIGGVWIVRATVRNRDLIATHRGVFSARFPGPGRPWIRALTDRDEPMPRAPAILWASVDGKRLHPARLSGP